MTVNTTSSSGSDTQFRISEYVQALIIIMYTVITVIAIGGNSVVCYLVYAYKRMHTVPNYFIVNLAISDIIMAVFCIPFTFVANLLLNYWPFGEHMCPIVSYIQTVAVFLSAYTLVAMSMDRYIVIVHPFKRRTTVKQTGIVILIIWVLSLSIPLPTFLKSKVVYYSNTSGQCYEQWETNNEKYAYGLALMILHYFAPLTLLLFSYSKIGYNIWVKKIQGNDRNKRKLQLAAAKKRMIKMMITVVVFYALCWLPFHVITLIGDNNPNIYNNKYVPIMWLCFHWLSMSNSCYNPIIYLWMSPKFRTGLKLAVNSCLHRKQNSCTSEEEVYQQIHMIFPRLRVELQENNNLNTQRQKPRRQNKHIEALRTDEYMIPGIHSDT